MKKLGDLCLDCIQQHLSSISQLPSHLPTLYKERLIERLAYHDMLDKMYLPHVSYNLFCASLRHIKLYKCSQVDDHFLTLLADSQCQLEVLVIDGCHKVTDVGVRAITTGQTVLCVLELSKLIQITSAALKAVHSSLLWRVKIKNCPLISCDGVTALVNHCQHIKILSILLCSKLERYVYTAIATALGSVLEELDLGIPGITDEELVSLSRYCPSLRRLNLTGAKAIGKDALIKLFQGCIKLETLDLSFCSRLAKPEDCQVLWTLPQTLKELSLCGIQLQDEQVLIESMQRLPLLTSLRLCGVSALNDATLEKILEHVGINLEVLDISGGFTKTLTDKGLEAVTRYCPQLQELFLNLLTEVTGFTLIPILQQPERAANFRKLHLSCRQLDRDFLSLVTVSCPELTLLEMSGIAVVTDELLFQLAENCPRLSHLAIKGCRQVTDIGLCKVICHCPIRSIVLSGIHNLTDKCIFALANSRPELEEIYLSGCAQITPAAVRYLCDCCITRLFVHHAIPNALPDQLMAKNLDTGDFCRADLLPGR